MNKSNVFHNRQNIPRLAIISSIAGLGHVSLTAALPVVSVLGVQPCPLPSSVLSGHLAYPAVYKTDLTGQMAEFLSVWEKLDTQFDGIYIGYLADAEQVRLLTEKLKETRHKPEAYSEGINPSGADLMAPGSRILIDPIMADHGIPYSSVTPAQITAMKELAALADVLTPNLTEVCLLTDTPYCENGWNPHALTQLCRRLDPAFQKQIVITGIPLQPLTVPQRCMNFLWEYGAAAAIEYESAGASRPGTGDIFASILAARMVSGHSLSAAVKQATEFISVCLADSEAAGIPVREGVLLERNLHLLLPPCSS